MIKDLEEFRQNLGDWGIFKNKKDGKVYIGMSGKDELYKECNMEELPVKFQESIKNIWKLDVEWAQV